jgi:Type II secretion system (T2SS), protein K
MKIKKRLRSRKGQRGIALVTVLIAIAITLVLTNEFGTTSSVDMIAAANYRDQVRSRFLARSAQAFGELVIRIQQRMDNASSKIPQLGGIQITDYANTLITPFCGSAEEVQGAIGFSSTQIKGLGADIGTCGFNGPIGTDDGKLDINCANVSTRGSAVHSVIDGLLYFPAYDAVFNDNDAGGWHRDRTLQALAIVDYIDKDTMQGNSNRGAAEDYGYESLKDRYYAKNTYIDTVGEMRLIRGVDDRFWTLFGDAFTTYGQCQINLKSVTNVQLIAAILYLAAKDRNDPVILDPKKLFLLAGYVAKAPELGENFSKVQDFIDFVKDPGSSVLGIAGSGAGTLQGSAAKSALTAGLPGLQEKIGLVLDPTLLGQIARVGNRRTYRLEAYGEIERMQKNKDGSPVFPAIRTTVTGVWDTKVVPQNVRRPPVPNGAWVYLRED